MTQDSENTNATPFIINGCRQDSAEKLDSGTEADTMPLAGDSRASSAISGDLQRQNSGISDVLSSDLEADQSNQRQQADSDSEAEPKRHVGGQPNNMNNFQSGVTWLKETKQGLRSAPDSKLLGRRFARELTNDLGGKEMLTAAKREIIDHLRRDKETLEDLFACRDEIIELKPAVKRNIAALAKIDSCIAPVMQRIVVNLMRLGLELARRGLSTLRRGKKPRPTANDHTLQRY